MSRFYRDQSLGEIRHYISRNRGVGHTALMKEGIKNFIRKISFQKIRPLSYTYFYESFYKELSSFFNSIKNDVETEVTAYDGLKTMEIIEEAYLKMVD